MFDTQIFSSWLAIVTGAFFFAMLFTFAGMMSDYIFSGSLHLSKQSLGLCALAFSGYVWIAAYHKRKRENS